MTRYRASAPGKLMIAGEYSVLSPGGGAVAMAVGRRLEVTVEPAPEDRVMSEALGLVACPLEADPRLAFVAQALRVVRAAASGGPLSIEVRGDAGQVDGRGVKLGLGSSAAVTVATVAAALAERGHETSTNTLFRLAALAHARAQGRAGSGYDIATQTVGGLVLVRPPRPDRLSDLADARIPSLVREDWPELTLTRAPWPQGLRFAACWVGTGAATPRMMARTDAARERAPERWERLLGAMRTSADEVARALASGEVERVLGSLEGAERALRAWDEELDLGVVTAAVRRAGDLANESGCVGRTSGAGGGDCVLAFAEDSGRLDAARAAWTRAGLVPIDLALDEMGTVVSKIGGKEDRSAG